MQNAPKLEGSGLNPESFKTDEVVNVFGTNIEDKINEENPVTFAIAKQDIKQEDDIESIKKRKFDARTGEEDEETVFQGDFKLFSWDLSTSNWIEKGRGQLKLNDSLDTEVPGSRLIMRISGTLRIILNVAIRHPTFKVINNTKTSIRFTDSQTVWAASGNNAHQLGELIEERLKDGKRLKVGDDSSEVRSDECNALKGETAESGDEPHQQEEEDRQSHQEEEDQLKEESQHKQPKEDNQPTSPQKEEDQPNQEADGGEKKEEQQEQQQQQRQVETNQEKEEGANCQQDDEETQPNEEDQQDQQKKEENQQNKS